MEIRAQSFVFLWSLICAISGQDVDKPRGPWTLVFKVVRGKWDPASTGYATFWELFTSTDTYNTENPVPDQRDFSLTSDHYKSDLIEDWQNGIISVQAIKMSFYKNNEEKVYVVFDASGKTKTTWFKCDNILYSSYTDLPDNTLPSDCPGRNVNGMPLTMMKLSYFQAACSMTTGWIIVADTNHLFSICPTYMPASGQPYFKYSSLTTYGNMIADLETADSMGIFFQTWDLVFKGVEGIKPDVIGLYNLTGLFTGELTENDNSDNTIQNLQHTQSSKTFKSGVINLWGSYFIDMVKYSMYKAIEEKAFVVFDGINSDKTTWFHEDNILYSSYDTELTDVTLETCSIEGDTYRNWQIQSISDVNDCTSSHQIGWMLVKERKNNGSCSWDNSPVKKKPYFLYNTGTQAASPSTFQYADVMAVFVHGWRMILKVSSGGDLSTKPSVYSMWADNGGVNEELADATDINSATTYKSSIIDLWSNYYIRAVKVAAYKDGQEVLNIIFDATASSSTDWFDCGRILYTSVNGLNSTSAIDNSYNCSLAGVSSTFRFLIGKSTDCDTASATGIFTVIDADSTCSSRNDLPQFVYSNTLDTTLSESTSSMLADTFVVFVDMPNCYTDTCSNGGTCQDLGGQYRCFCVGDYYGDSCSDLDGTYSQWSEWSSCSVTCETGVETRTRTCEGTEGNGICIGDSEESTSCTLSSCPIDGGFSDWSAWDSCSQTCDEGTQSRTRSCTNPSPQYGGAPCEGDVTDEQPCLVEHCPINGGFSEWSAWGSCSTTCDEGTQSRTRSCTNPIPQHGGTTCSGHTNEYQSCFEVNCPIDGQWENWGTWSDCDVTCGGGTISRNRTCTGVQYGGLDCTGEDTESDTCNDSPCPIDGQWENWGSWSDCDVSCSGGTIFRNRTCTEVQYGGLDCIGEDTESDTCNDSPCPIDGEWENWSAWSDCDVTCGGGTINRNRSCTEAQYGGLDCIGEDTESDTCNDSPCPIDGQWENWGEWSDCDVTCGGGTINRNRSCTEAQFGGLDCIGEDTESDTCNDSPCPIDGEWENWSAWSDCDVTCGGGTINRNRTCTEAQYGGLDCVGEDTESNTCNDSPCPIDGQWENWGEWSDCDVSCGGGTIIRNRTCTEAQYGGLDCIGEDTESDTCNDSPCPIDGEWENWSAWSDCDVTCGGGTINRNRSCTEAQFGGLDCIGEDTESDTCNDSPCPIDGEWENWSTWSDCDVTCGGGTITRNRTCTEAQYGGLDCVGEDTESDTCNDSPCPIDGEWENWSTWSDCDVTCGGGTITRNRTCTEAQYGGLDCVGEDTESDTCNDSPCPIDGQWENWSTWSDCDVTCGGGTITRNRTCTEAQYGGLDCVGEDSEADTCNDSPCPIDGEWENWSVWSDCDVTCGGGTITRNRTCTGAQYGGLDCVGEDTESDTCNDSPCPIDGEWENWSAWSDCDSTCGGGTITRNRTCTEAQYGGLDCLGEETETDTCNDSPCPIDGQWENWSAWSNCDVSCGGGRITRNRTCTEAQHGGLDCIGEDTETVICNDSPCPIDGQWESWSAWSDCDVTCGGGTITRNRTCTETQYGGLDCIGEDTESDICNDSPCPIDGEWENWSAWSDCDVTCGGGIINRNRTCTDAQYEGLDCVGEDTESDTCNDSPCPIDGQWENWSAWSECDVTCSGGTITRNRTCTEAQYGGLDCIGEDTETDTCNDSPCPIDGQWEYWSAWSSCDVSCGGGTLTRNRTCTEPRYGGLDCIGEDSESDTCNNSPCPVDGVWDNWSIWSDCDVTCNSGTRTRNRTCTGVQYGGLDCIGEDTESDTCNDSPCPIDGQWESWGSWSDCDVTCGGGTITRNRTCTEAQYGGLDCIGEDTESDSCNDSPCPIDGQWENWSAWSDCDVTCGGGTITRNRTCADAQYGGLDCIGEDTESDTCIVSPCPIDGHWENWSAWSDCDITCGGGTITRNRTCTGVQYGGLDCIGEDTETDICNDSPCPIDGQWENWGAWSDCDATCGGGTITRNRTCTDAQYGGLDCIGEATESDSCNDSPCPIDGLWLSWSSWSDCDVTCGGGTITRNRTCTGVQYGGLDCFGEDTEFNSCNVSPCPMDGQWDNWGAWSDCDVSCGGGTRTRNRTCTGVQYGGLDCIGEDIDPDSCNDSPCPIDGQWENWGAWSGCDVTCGGGTITRNRTCTEVQYGGLDCIGDDMDSDTCNDSPCPIDGMWESWGAWSGCDVTCGGGTMNRNRSCTGPQYDGLDCIGADTESDSCNNSPCPIDGQWESWGVWSDCNVTCGGGIIIRNRTCTGVQYGGLDCSDEDTEYDTCNDSPCPIDGQWENWGAWSNCNVTCGGGTITRHRICTGVQYGGSDCFGGDTEYDSCNDSPCPIDGQWESWGAWSDCDVTCGDSGTMTRNRTCSGVQYGGLDCIGDDTEFEMCNNSPCPVDGQWESWGAWSDCDATCGGGTITRNRTCTGVQYGGIYCIGEDTESNTCNDSPCPIDGQWESWGAWSDCDVTCDGGTMTRNRTCSGVQYGGSDCIGVDSESDTCNYSPCPIDGQWENWSAWSDCDVTCGGGTTTRNRTCTEAQYGGLDCIGENMESDTCNDSPCPVSGFGEWSNWGVCSMSCGAGTQQRSRICEIPDDGCDGDTDDVRECSGPDCPINGGYSEWSDWDSCTVTCNNGTRSRSRVCDSPTPAFGGEDCDGFDTDTQDCANEKCPVDGLWESWGAWSNCEVTCGDGTITRNRTCTGVQYGGLDCLGEDTESDTCDNSPCPIDGYWAAWTEWTSCTSTCDDGTRNRSRACVEPQYGGQQCVGEAAQTEDCNTDPCPVDGYWSTWSEWSSCSVSCSDGITIRSRTCVGPLYGGLDCVGDETESQSCNDGGCPVNGVWSEWSTWSTCTLTCGGGTFTRTRTCSEPENNRLNCEGDFEETNTCNITPCPVDSYWSSWSMWSSCTVSCGGGLLSRTRTCVQPQYGGQACPDVDNEEETQPCNTYQCPVWTSWSDWTGCSATCNGGSRSRDRVCTHLIPNVIQCSGHSTEVEVCGNTICPAIDGGWSSWSNWTHCSVSCGFGEIVRSRTCTEPSPKWNGLYCDGVHVESTYCVEDQCPVNGKWSTWSKWSPCLNMTSPTCNQSCTCGDGIRGRYRLCNNPPPDTNGAHCVGDYLEIEDCRDPCYKVKCSKQQPDACQIILTKVGGSGGASSVVTTTFSVSLVSLVRNILVNLYT